MDTILSINRGSSSLKFALYESPPAGPLELLLSGNIERIGRPNAGLTAHNRRTNERFDEPLPPSATDAGAYLIEWLARQASLHDLRAIGHRIVHGGPRYCEPQRVTTDLVAELRRISFYDPEHMPAEIELIESLGKQFPNLTQVACFDTAFHRSMPRVARILPIPRRYEELGVERYGFHGLSYEYLLHELARRAGQQAANGRVILAHLGSGASLAAVRGGSSIDTSMAFTPTAGLPMATRTGDLDPGLVSFLARTEKMSVEQFHEMVNHRSGLLGVSETTGDMQELLAAEAADLRAAEAVALFCYQTRKWIGAFAAALEGLDALVFSGGIGEHSSMIRRRVCEGLSWLGVQLDPQANDKGEFVISASDSRVAVYTIATDEQWIIARAAAAIIAANR